MLFKKPGYYAKAERLDDGRILRFYLEETKEAAIRTENASSGAYQNYTELLEDGYTPEPLDLETLSIGDYVEENGTKHRVLSASGVGKWRVYHINNKMEAENALSGWCYTAANLGISNFKPVAWPEQKSQARTVEDVLKDLPEADRAIVRKAVK